MPEAHFPGGKGVEECILKYLSIYSFFFVRIGSDHNLCIF